MIWRRFPERSAVLSRTSVAVPLLLLLLARLSAQAPDLSAIKTTSPGAGAQSRDAETVLHQTFSDYSYDTLEHACLAAAELNRTLVVSQKWRALPALSCMADLQMVAGGLIQPAKSQVIIIAGSFSSPDTQTLDTSLGGPGSIVFTRSTIAHAEWFGATSIPDVFGSVTAAAATLNTLAVRSASAAFPVAPAVFAGPSAVAVRYGSFSIGCGTFVVNDTIYITMQQRFEFACGGASNLKLADNTFTTAEKFVIEVLRRNIDGLLVANETANVHITGGGRIDANGASNPFASCVKFFGSESSSADFSGLIGCARRGLAIGETAANDPAFFNNSSDDIHIRAAISGLGPGSSGPGLYFHCSGCVFEGPVQHFNGAGRFNGVAAPGEPNPEVWIDHSYDVSLDHSYGECEVRFAQITDSVVVHLNDVTADAQGLPGCRGTSAVGILVSGNSSQIYGYGRAGGYNTAFEDRSSQFGGGPYPSFPGNPRFYVPWGPYNSSPVTFAGGISIPPFQQTMLGATSLLNGVVKLPRVTTTVAGAKSWQLFVGSAGTDANPSAELLSCDSDGSSDCFRYFQLSRQPQGTYNGFQNVFDPAGTGGTAIGGRFGIIKLKSPPGHAYFLCVDDQGVVVSQPVPCQG